MKACITRFGCVVAKSDLNKITTAFLKKSLTLTPKQTYGNFKVNRIKLYKELDNYYIVPSHYFQHTNFPENVELTSTLKYPDQKLTLIDNIILRDYQQNVLQTILENDNDCIIQLPTSKGKTVISLKLIGSLQQKTLILVNKTELVNQWKARIKQFIPNADIGTIQGKIFDVKDKDIVVSTIQTISMKDEITPMKINECNFGIVILDEIHNVCADVFSEVLFKVNVKLKIGLTATPHRQDGLESIYKLHCGKVFDFSSDDTTKQCTEIKIIRYESDLKEKFLYDNKTPAVSTMLTDMSGNLPRTKMIADLLCKLLSNPHRKILVLSDRKKLLKTLRQHSSLSDYSSLYLGDTKESLDSRIILGTYAVCSEGFDLKSLNCLVFVTPRGNITQSIGRIFRQHHDNITPLIVDIVDNYSLFKTQFYKRKRLYKKELTKIVWLDDSIDSDDIPEENQFELSALSISNTDEYAL